MSFTLLSCDFDINLRARHKWTHMRRHGGRKYWHLVWGCLSVLVEPQLNREDCDHEFDRDEGMTCLNCGADGSDGGVDADLLYDLAKEGA